MPRQVFPHRLELLWLPSSRRPHLGNPVREILRSMPFERLLAAPLIGLLRLLGRLPLGLYHSLGARLGRLAYHFSPRVSRRIRDHLKLSGVCASEAEYERVLRVNIDETGKQAIEMLALWFRPEREASALVRSCRGEQEVQAAYREGRGVILLTPHLGCFEVAAIYAAQQVPITVLYRQPRVTWLRPLIVAGRERGRLKLAPASVHGVRLLLGALRRGEAIGILPDQVPRFGEGLWVDFFGRPAYTMTLIGRLWQVTRAPVFVATAIRRP